MPVTCARGALTVVVSVTEAGLLASIQLAPASAAKPTAPRQPPPYVDPTAFDERDVTLGSGPLAVPGTLSLPRRRGAHSAIALLAGSGVLDRGETIGRNKPLKDLAWGLATGGVVVLRFDNVTFAHPTEVRSATGFRVADEYDPVAVAASLHCPILLVQGGRDYQVTVEDDLERRRSGLAGHANVTVCVYPGDTHLFFAGTGPSSPAEYEPEVTGMDAPAIADLASAHSISVHQLVPRNASLEQAYLDLTGESVEYHAGAPSGFGAAGR